MLGAWLVVAEYIYFGLAVLAAICWLIGYRLHLNFGRDVLKKTNDPAILKAAAEFTRSYRSANFKSFTDAIAKLAGRGRRSIELRQAFKHTASAGVLGELSSHDTLHEGIPFGWREYEDRAVTLGLAVPYRMVTAWKHGVFDAVAS